MAKITETRHNLHLPTDLKKRLAHSAIDNHRSMNAEILARLERSFEPEAGREIENLLRSFAELDATSRKEAFRLLAEVAEIITKR